MYPKQILLKLLQFQKNLYLKLILCNNYEKYISIIFLSYLNLKFVHVIYKNVSIIELEIVQVLVLYIKLIIINYRILLCQVSLNNQHFPKFVRGLGKGDFLFFIILQIFKTFCHKCNRRIAWLLRHRI